MSSYIAIFAYDFPHRKSCDFIKDIFSNGFKNLVIFAAPRKKLPHLSGQNGSQPSSSDDDRQSTSKLCMNLGLPYFSIQHSDVDELRLQVLKYKVEIAIIAGARILSAEVISLFQQGVVNFHPGKIPETSGLDAFAYTLQKGVAAGVTTHFIDHRVDAGNFIRFNKLIIKEDDVVSSVQEGIYQQQLNALHDFLCDLKAARIKSNPIYRPHKNSPMSDDDKRRAFSGFNKWKAKQLALQFQDEFFLDCQMGKLEAVANKLLYDASLVHFTNDKGWTPLIVACFNQQIEIVKLLLSNGADPNRCGAKGTSPLMYAKTKICENRSVDFSLLSLLISSGADISRTDCYGKNLKYYVEQLDNAALTEYVRMHAS